MRRLLLILLYALGGAGSESSLLLDLNFTQQPPNSNLVFCTPNIPEEQVSQVHWKERHANGTYSVIAVVNPHWGNSTKFPYQEKVTLHRKDDKTYMMEITASPIDVCCEVVTFPSGRTYMNCMSIKGDSDTYGFRSAVLGISLVGGFFVLASCALICHICWMRKSSRRVFEFRGSREEVWARSRRSQVPYRRTLPSINHAYEPPHEIGLQSDTPPPTRAHPLHQRPTNQLPSHELPSRNPTMNSHWSSNDPPLSVPPRRNHTKHEVLPPPHQLYGNISHHKKKYPKVHHAKRLQLEPTLHQDHPEMFPHVDPSSSVPYYHTQSYPCLYNGASGSSGDIDSSHSRVNVPRTPESPFTTINPMYHSGTGWASQPNNNHVKYEHSRIS